MPQTVIRFFGVLLLLCPLTSYSAPYDENQLPSDPQRHEALRGSAYAFAPWDQAYQLDELDEGACLGVSMFFISEAFFHPDHTAGAFRLLSEGGAENEEDPEETILRFQDRIRQSEDSWPTETTEESHIWDQLGFISEVIDLRPPVPAPENSDLSMDGDSERYEDVEDMIDITDIRGGLENAAGRNWLEFRIDELREALFQAMHHGLNRNRNQRVAFEIGLETIDVDDRLIMRHYASEAHSISVVVEPDGQTFVFDPNVGIAVYATFQLFQEHFDAYLNNFTQYGLASPPRASTIYLPRTVRILTWPDDTPADLSEHHEMAGAFTRPDPFQEPFQGPFQQIQPLDYSCQVSYLAVSKRSVSFASVDDRYKTRTRKRHDYPTLGDYLYQEKHAGKKRWKLAEELFKNNTYLSFLQSEKAYFVRGDLDGHNNYQLIIEDTCGKKVMAYRRNAVTGKYKPSYYNGHDALGSELDFYEIPVTFKKGAVTFDQLKKGPLHPHDLHRFLGLTPTISLPNNSGVKNLRDFYNGYNAWYYSWSDINEDTYKLYANGHYYRNVIVKSDKAGPNLDYEVHTLIALPSPYGKTAYGLFMAYVDGKAIYGHDYGMSKTLSWTP